MVLGPDQVLTATEVGESGPDISANVSRCDGARILLLLVTARGAHLGLQKSKKWGPGRVVANEEVSRLPHHPEPTRLPTSPLAVIQAQSRTGPLLGPER